MMEMWESPQETLMIDQIPGPQRRPVPQVRENHLFVPRKASFHDLFVFLSGQGAGHIEKNASTAKQRASVVEDCPLKLRKPRDVLLFLVPLPVRVP